MRVNKCDFCGTETQSTTQWFDLSIPWTDETLMHREGFMTLGKNEKEFCSARCVIAYLHKEDE